MFGVPQRRVREQRSDRGEAQVPGAGAVVPVVFEVSKNAVIVAASRSAQSSCARGRPWRLLGEGDEQPHRVSIDGDRSRADPALLDEAVGEEALHRRRDQCHRPAPPR